MVSAAIQEIGGADVVSAAKALAPRIVAGREKAEELRQTPTELADAIARAGLYQMFLPRSVGGAELPPLTGFEAVEELSKADGSVGWCAMIATDLSLLTGWLDPEVLKEMCGDPIDLRVAGSLRPQGRAWKVEGGYRVKGQWNFASGVQHARWVYAPCVIMDGDKPTTSPDGVPVMRTMWLPIENATTLDTWSVIGMRGTGSQDFTVDDVFVPSERTSFMGEAPIEQGPLYQPRTVLTMLWALAAGNALGIARGAIDTFIEMANRDASTQSTSLLRDRPLVQSKIGQAEAILNSARAYVVDAVGKVWDALCSNASDPSYEIAQSRLAITHAINEAVRVVDIVFHAAGTNAIYTRNPLERYFRDIHVAVQHNSAFPAHYESAGKVLLGLRPFDMGW